MSSDDLASLVMQWQPRIRAFFARRCGAQDDVNDLVQETIASIIKCYPGFAHRSSVGTWIYAVCRNVFSNYLYYRGRDRRLIGRLIQEAPTAETQEPVALRAAIGRLSAESRRLYGLYYVDGLAIRQIATILCRPEGTVKYLLHELRRQVKNLLST
jgi:RNA polymerase sigma factor (sigma-70 family)